MSAQAQILGRCLAEPGCYQFVADLGTLCEPSVARSFNRRNMDEHVLALTIRLDEDLVDYFGAIADRSGGKIGYQTLINSALREYVEGKTPKWEETLRRIIREEMSRNNAAQRTRFRPNTGALRG